jgi:Family of unknown function (DUF5670)
MFILLFVVLLVIWILGWTTFHVANAAIHVLLLAAILSLVIHFLRGRSTVA